MILPAARGCTPDPARACLALGRRRHSRRFVPPADTSFAPRGTRRHPGLHDVVLGARENLLSRLGGAEWIHVCFPAGTGVAHAFENPFRAGCRLLGIGSWDPDEIAVYPDSGKAKLRAMDAVVRWPQGSLDYWDGEPVDEPLGPA